MAEEKDSGETKGKGGDEGKKDEKKSNNNGNPNAIVLKIDMHCEGCASKIIKCAKSFQGVETARVEWAASKLTVEGKVDPTKLRERLQQKTKKKVELVSPQQQQQPKKDKENKDGNTNNTAGNNGGGGKGQGKKGDDKKPKELPVTTVVLKLGLHCQGCVQKIHKFVSKTSGVRSVTIDREKDLVTVTGAVDAKSLAESLKARMKRVVEIVTPKKEKEKGKDNEEKKEGNNNGNRNGEGGGNQNECGGNGNNNGNGNGNSGKKKKGGGGGGGGNKEEEGNGGMMGKMEGSRMEYCGAVGYPANTGFGYGFGYNGYPGYTYGENVHAPQYFSDENPNACSVM